MAKSGNGWGAILVEKSGARYQLKRVYSVNGDKLDGNGRSYSVVRRYVATPKGGWR